MVAILGLSASASAGRLYQHTPTCMVTIVNAEEFKAKNSSKLAGSGTGTANYHALAVKVKTPTGLTLTGGRTIYKTSTGQNVYCAYVLDEYGYSLGVNGYGAIDATGITGGAQSGTIHPSSTTTEAATMVVLGSSGGSVPVHLRSSGGISGTTLGVEVQLRYGYHYTDPNTNQPVYLGGYEYDYHSVPISKLVCTDASIDTRRAFGQPDVEGALPGDANAELRNVNFGEWIYKGGLFAGYVPYSMGSDQSGRARIQLSNSGISTWTNVKAITLSMLDMGKPSSMSDGISLGVYVPSSTDPNRDVAETSVTWATRFDVDPDTETTPPDYRRTPLRSLTVSGTSHDYVNWKLWDTTETIPAPTFDPSRLCVRATGDETTTCWRYFQSRENEALAGSNYPDADGRPRVWVVESTEVYTEHGDLGYNGPGGGFGSTGGGGSSESVKTGPGSGRRGGRGGRGGKGGTKPSGGKGTGAEPQSGTKQSASKNQGGRA